jgi:hypothetical protein
MIKLEKYGVQDLRVEEQKSVNGGGFQAFIGTIMLAIYIYNETPSFAKGFKEGYNSIDKVKYS